VERCVCGTAPGAAITGPDPEDDLIDHTGRLLRIMADCGGCVR
jgi:hypothetical protein